jgi:hypothetical protein
MKIISVTYNNQLAQKSATNVDSDSVTLHTGLFSKIEEKIEKVQIIDEVSKDKSPVIRTLVGAALLGPLGALAGAASGLSNTVMIKIGITAGSLKVLALVSERELHSKYASVVETEIMSF